MKKIQAAAAGFGGSPVTLYSAYDPETGVLVLAALKAHTTERQEGCTFISNSTRSECDVLSRTISSATQSRPTTTC